MEENNSVQKRLTEIFDDANIYTELRNRIKDYIFNKLYYSKYKDTQFYKSPKIFDQFVDIFIKDILNDCDFEEFAKKINRLQNPNKEEIYLYRRDHRANRFILDSETRHILEKVHRGISLEPEEENKYKEFKQKKLDFDSNNQLVFEFLNGVKLSEDKKVKMDEYLKTLLTEEEALEGLKKENETRIKNLRIRAKNLF